ncbi:hypothetical protein AIIKEEIJ_04062 [Rhodococcus sp. YH1]|nr:hypothetical protein [Rhodococcus sp. YH1]
MAIAAYGDAVAGEVFAHRAPSQVFVERAGAVRAGAGEQLGCCSAPLVRMGEKQLDQARTDPATPQRRPDGDRGQQSYRHGIDLGRVRGRP